MEKRLQIVRLKDKNNDFLYWQSVSETERLQAIEMLRQQYINHNKNVQLGFQRVYRIVNQKQR